jgi:hypothetical protein
MGAPQAPGQLDTTQPDTLGGDLAALTPSSKVSRPAVREKRGRYRIKARARMTSGQHTRAPTQPTEKGLHCPGNRSRSDRPLCRYQRDSSGVY